MLPALCLNDLMTRAEQGENLNRTTGKETKTGDNSVGGGVRWVALLQCTGARPRDGGPEMSSFQLSVFFKRRDN